jgi:hypothetical protein
MNLALDERTVPQEPQRPSAADSQFGRSLKGVVGDERYQLVRTTP